MTPGQPGSQVFPLSRRAGEGWGEGFTGLDHDDTPPHPHPILFGTNTAPVGKPARLSAGGSNPRLPSAQHDVLQGAAERPVRVGRSFKAGLL